jgi:hypothetical protein
VSHDPGAAELRAVLEAPSVPLEDAVEALATSLESAHGAEAGGAKLPQSALAPIGKMQNYYSRLLQHIGEIETSNPGRREAIKALQRMETGLNNFAAAVRVEGEEAEQEVALGAAEMDRAGSELARAVGRLS